ncbi:hypothetical protein BB560_002355 [Smittium megazygosporum]|uniref:Uncharacterized protein n=1 Tax=Smittium megazygosporum TaxID=133381 RepID=A0A2T9ZF63_9FUNG|nr:hypothetical protein BB560_002355 [Smittium megazygosporum]
MHNFISIYNVDPKLKEFSIEDFAPVLVSAWFYIAKIIPSRLINIIVDLSVEPNLYFALIQEQKDLISKYGHDITYEIAKKMIFLDAFIMESLKNSNSASSIYRIIQNDIFLSNGTLLTKGETSSINLFSKARTNTSNVNRKFDIRKHILNKRSFTEPSIDNLLWGYGVKECPFAEYAGNLIKTFTALLIRNLYIFLNIDGNIPIHPGYMNLFIVHPLTSFVYFKKHDIDKYRDLIDLEEEFNNIINSNSNKIALEQRRTK